jgi:thiol-disulfide isomerase/thioredoxin
MFFSRQTWPRRNRVIRVAIAGAVVLGLGLTNRARAQAPETKTLELKTGKPEPKRDDPKSRALFDEVSKAYKGLASYSDQGQFIIAMSIGGKPQKQVLPLKLTLVRPNKVEMDAGQVQITSDGKTMTTAVIPLKRYSTTAAPEKISIETFREGPLGSVLFGGPSGPPMFLLLNLLTAADPAAAVAQIGGSLQPAPAAPPKAGGTAKPESPELLIDLAEGQPDILLTIDPATKLLSGIDMKIDPKLVAQAAKGGQELAIDQFGWSSGAISTQVPKDRSFAYEAPKGFAKVDSILEPQAEKPSSALVGKPSPDFTLTLLDGPGKTKTVTKAELAGKVVVIDFWATWCGPCMKELPEIQKLIDSFANTDKNVLVVALSQDSQPAEISEVRKLIEKTLTEKKIGLTGNPVGRIALDPSATIGSAFNVEGIPTLVILDGKGIVQSVRVGYDPDAPEPLSKTLAKEIDSLLAGKSLVGPKDSANPAAKKDVEDKP